MTDPNHQRRWDEVRSAVRRLASNDDFQTFLNHLKLLKEDARQLTYDDEIMGDPTLLLQETILQKCIDRILEVAGADRGESIDADDLLHQDLNHGPPQKEGFEVI